MKSFVYIALSLLPLISALPLDDPLQNGKTVEEKYIITLKPGVKAPEISGHVDWVERVHKRSLDSRGLLGDEKKNKGKRKGRKKHRGVEKVWKGNFKGYSGEFDKETIAEIKENKDVSHSYHEICCRQLNSPRSSSSSPSKSSTSTQPSPKAASPGVSAPSPTAPLAQPNTCTTKAPETTPGRTSSTPVSTRSTKNSKAVRSWATTRTRARSSRMFRGMARIALVRSAVEPMGLLRKQTSCLSRSLMMVP